ncbi:MAG: acyl-CoA dehydrogenase family protein [Acidimicrobiales bacterium]|nr:acyl-CoA dehydrogenase family protein [Acidimicrobiales bacterium]
MFSEPDAGSDLANVGMSAEKDGEEWILNGSKVWTSRGAYSKWGMCLARTDPEMTKHSGLTMFAVDMKSPGIEVRTIEQMNGDRHFSEVFVSNVAVEDRNRIGNLGDGWKIAVKTLALERSSLGGRSFGGGDQSNGLPTWLEDWKVKGYLNDPVSRQKAMKAFMLHRVNQLTILRATLSGNSSGPAGSGAKLRSVLAFKFRAYLSKEFFGAKGMLINDHEHVEFLTGPSMSIRGGTDEVQRNILGERVLGLPTEHRVDKEGSYRELMRGK